MTKILLITGIIAATLVPAAFAADPVPADFKNAAKYCQAARTAASGDAFKTQWGTNKNKKNAFGKCVSATAKAKTAKREDAEKKDDDDASEAKATAECKKQQTADATKFAQEHKNFGQCVKAGKVKD